MSPIDERLPSPVELAFFLSAARSAVKGALLLRVHFYPLPRAGPHTLASGKKGAGVGIVDCGNHSEDCRIIFRKTEAACSVALFFDKGAFHATSRLPLARSAASSVIPVRLLMMATCCHPNRCSGRQAQFLPRKRLAAIPAQFHAQIPRAYAYRSASLDPEATGKALVKKGIPPNYGPGLAMKFFVEYRSGSGLG